MNACLITGGSGFIGSHFARLACLRDFSPIIVVDCRTYAGQSGQIQALAASGKLIFFQDDICNDHRLDDIFKQFDIAVVVNFAAETHVDRSIMDAKAFLHSNVVGTFTLLETIRKHWNTYSPHRLFLQVSTDEVFGDLTLEATPFTEDSPYRPRNPYSATKAAADHLVRAWSNTYRLPSVITHSCNNYGPWQYPEKLIPLMILNAMEMKELPVYGDGSQVRDWIHVEDHCEALLSIIECQNRSAQYTISSGEEHRNMEIVINICDTVDRLLKRPLGTSRALIRSVADRPGHDRRYSLNAQKVRDQTGWRPSHSLFKTIPSLVEWYLSMGSWVDALRNSQDYRAYYDAQYAKSI